MRENTERSAISGFVDPAFRRVREVFEANFEGAADVVEGGAAFAVQSGGRLVVDLWGGVRKAETGEPWTPDTLVNVWSTTKSVVAIAVAQLVAEGRLDYDAPVADFWPEFAQAEKASITVGQLLSHQAGLNGFVEPTTIEDFSDWSLVTGRLAAQAPAWTPGEKTSYHAITWGFLAGEIIRRVTGLSPRERIARAISKPLGADFYIGAAPEDWSRIAPLIPPPAPAADGDAPAFDPIAAAAVLNPSLSGDDANAPAWRMAEIPAANGHATARALAQIYGDLGRPGGILEAPGVAAMTAIRSRRDDLLEGPGAWAAGLMINRGGLFGPGAQAFGHYGWGGSYAYRDPEIDVAVGYTLNRMAPELDPLGMALTAAVAECAGRAGS